MLLNIFIRIIYSANKSHAFANPALAALPPTIPPAIPPITVAEPATAPAAAPIASATPINSFLQKLFHHYISLFIIS